MFDKAEQDFKELSEKKRIVTNDKDKIHQVFLPLPFLTQNDPPGQLPSVDHLQALFDLEYICVAVGLGHTHGAVRYLTCACVQHG